MKRRGVLATVGLFVAISLLVGCATVQVSTTNTTAKQGAPVATPTNLVMVHVERVVDGDTIQVLYKGKKESVRLIGVDTPETVHPSKPVQPYGPEASAFTKEHLTGKDVGLEFDVEQRDKYGRLLAYVWLGNEMFNRTLVREGYAQMATFPPNVRHVDEFKALQQEAREAHRGLWGLKDGPTQPSMDNTAEEKAPSQAGAPPATWQPTNGQCVWNGKEQIKGNISSNDKVYHSPGQRNYAQTNPEACFATPKDAEAAGYRASKV